MKRRTYAIPTNDREILIDPPINSVPELIESNNSKFSSYDFNICDIPFQEFRSMVCNEVLKKATEYTKQISSNEQRATSSEIIIQTGYRPTFYHPGIWIKNHLAYHIAKQINGTSVNICVDNDVCHENVISVPEAVEDEITQEKVEFIERKSNLALEELEFLDTNKVGYFRDRVLACINGPTSGGAKTFEKFAGFMIDAAKKTSNAGEILTISRRKFEDVFGIHNLEIPVSKICEGDGFLIFFLAILLDYMRFANIYNDRLECYREANKLRAKASALGGLPYLKVDENTAELPFWAWRRGEPRKRLFASASGGLDNKRICLIFENLPVLSLDAGDTVGVWEQLASVKELVNSGIKIRPRAITVTMFSRLFLSTLFIHGIGGARYDVITDSIIKEFFGCEPPDFLTASATLYLPFQAFDVTAADLDARRHKLRDMQYNPEKYLSPDLKAKDEVSALIKEKQKILETMDIKNPEERSGKFKRVKEINDLLKDKLLPQIQRENDKLKWMERQVLQSEIMRDRTYPFCIYPESLLRDFYGQVVSFKVL